MSDFAKDNHNQILNSASFDDESWELLKTTYQIGDLKMLDCNCDAIPKTSINFKKFFAHYNDECNTAPETIWHKTAKQAVLEALYELGISGIQEKSGNKWRADVYFELQCRNIAIELQKSPQTLKQYLIRQEKYKSSKVECFWLLNEPRFISINKAIAKHKLKSGALPPFSNCIEEIPTLLYDENKNILKTYKFNSSVKDFLTGIVKGKFIFADDRWQILP